MKKCTNCGAENQDSRRWCRNCMKELPDAPMHETGEILPEAKESETRKSRLNGSMGKTVYGRPEEHTAGDKTQSPVSGFASSGKPANSPNTLPNAKSDNLTVSKLSGSIGSKRYTSEEQIPESRPNNSNFKGNLASSNDSHVPVQPKKKLNRSRQKKKFHWKVAGITVASIVAILLLTAGLYWGRSIFDDRNDESEKSPEITSPDAEEYYERNSRVVSVIDAKDSKTVLTEAETCDMLVERGFTQYSVTSTYSMDGEYYISEDISETSSEKHPLYETYYVTENGDIWTIFMVNGVVMANPASYNLQSGLEVQVIISETDTMMSYDCITNTFYETIPDESALIVKIVDQIDAATLEKLTFEEIDGL